MENNLINNTAKLLLNVFSDSYTNEFEKMLMSGGGGNSMFVNAWGKPSATFVRYRVSGEAKKRLADFGYTLESVPHIFYRNNAKTIEGRRSVGKELHFDHNPGNVKVLQLIRDKARSYPDNMTKEEKIADLETFITNVQTVDLITIEQDHKRTHKDDLITKGEKNMLNAKERDDLLGDTWEWFDPINRSVY